MDHEKHCTLFSTMGREYVVPRLGAVDLIKNMSDFVEKVDLPLSPSGGGSGLRRAEVATATQAGEDVYINKVLSQF